MADSSRKAQDGCQDDGDWLLVQNEEANDDGPKLNDYLLHMISEIQRKLITVSGLARSDSSWPPEEGLEYIGKAAEQICGTVDVLSTLLNANLRDPFRDCKYFFIAEATANILMSVKPAAEQKALDIIFDIGHPANMDSFAAEAHFRRILGGILDGLIQLTCHGRINLSLSVSEEDGCPDGFCIGKFAISYTASSEKGYGLEDPILRLHQMLGRRRNFGSSWYADSIYTDLSLVQHLIQRLDGKVWAEGGLGSTTLYLDLPFRMPDRAGRFADRITIDKYASHRVLVLQRGSTASEDVILCHLKLGSIKHRVMNADTDDALQAAFQEAYSAAVDCAIVDSLQLAIKFTELQTSKERKIPVLIAAPEISVNLSLLTEENMFSYLKTPCSTPEFALALHSAIQNTPPAVLAGLHVLVADDNQINRKVEQKIIEKATSILTKKAPRRVTQPSRRVHPLQMAEDGLQAVELEKKNRFDLILMDLDMPDMNGVDAAAEIRKWECANNLPRAQIVGVHPQGAMIPGGHDQFVASQMDGLLSKPLRQNQLTPAILGCASRLSGDWGDQ